MTPHALPHGRQGVGTQLAMTALTLAVIGSFALWQLRPSGDKPAAASARSTAHGGATAAAAPRAGLTEQYPEDQRARSALRTDTTETLDGAGAALARKARPTIYVVESQERAQAVRAALDEDNARWAALGQPPLVAEVVWFDSAEAEVQYWATQQLLGNGVGPPVIDLRARSRASCFEQDGTIPDVVRDTCAAVNMVQTIYLVDSEAEAAALRRAWAAADSERAAVGSAPRTVQVLVVMTDEDAAQVRLGQGRPGVFVIDRRIPSCDCL